MAERRTTACPGCGARTIPIVYGMPSGELFEKAERGDVFLGGCIIGTDDPIRVCTGYPPHVLSKGGSVRTLDEEIDEGE